MGKLYLNNHNPRTAYDIFKHEFNTGDLILFSGKHSIISSTIRLWTKSHYTHIGMVIVNPILEEPDGSQKELRGIYLIESGGEPILDADDKVYKFGVQIVSLEEVIESYEGSIYWRKLNISATTLTYNEIRIHLSKIYKYIKNKKYDLDLIDLLTIDLNIDIEQQVSTCIFFNWFRHDTQKQDKFVCSALVAFLYTKLNFLPSITQWTEVGPQYFSDENLDLKFENDVFLEDQQKIK